MSEHKAKANERAIAQQTQEKFEFYLLSVVFTLLALSIQTAKFGTWITADILELLGWLSFIVSGLAGLSRLEWVPHVRVQMSHRSDFEEEIFQLKKLKLEGQSELMVLESGKPQAIDDRIRNREDAIRQLTPVIEKNESRTFLKYRLHKYGFALGVLLVAAARSVQPIVGILGGLHLI